MILKSLNFIVGIIYLVFSPTSVWAERDFRQDVCPNGGKIKKTHWGYLGTGKGNTGAHLAGQVSYDFDFVEVTNVQTHADSDIHRYHAKDGKLFEARWRSPRTIMTITMSPPELREILTDAGFGYDFSGERLPAGRFRAEEEDMRHALVTRLSNILLERQDENIDLGHFNMHQMFAAHAESLPLRPSGAVENIGPPGNGKFMLVLLSVLAISLGMYAAITMTEVPADLVARLAEYLPERR